MSDGCPTDNWEPSLKIIKKNDNFQKSIKRVIAIGDDMNDRTMLEVAGLGIAMENSNDEFKKLADEITKTNTQNGVAEVLLNKF